MDKWKHIKDQLPEVRDIVLTFWNSGKYQVLQYCGDEGRRWFGVGGEIYNISHCSGSSLFECITHWMRLPELPVDSEYYNDCKNTIDTTGKEE